MSAEPTIVSVSEGDFTVTTNTGTAEQVTESLRQQEAPAAPEKEEKPDLSKAASELGKKGGEAAAKARKAAEAKKDDKPAEKPEAKPAEEPDEAESEKRKLADDIAKEPDPEKKKQLASERVAEATRRAAAKVREAEARAAKIEAEAQTLRAQLEAARRPTSAESGATPRSGAAAEKGPAAAPDFDGADPEPEEGDFEQHKDYVKALASWQYRQEHSKVQREEGARKFADSAVQHFDSFRSRVNEAVKAGSAKVDELIPFEEVVSNCSYVQPPGQALTAFNCINDELLGARHPAAMMAFLKGNPSAMRYLLGLQSRDAITREMARIEGALARSSQRSEGATTGTPPTEREVSRAEPPVTPVAGSPSFASPAPRNGGSDDEWFRRNYLKR